MPVITIFRLAAVIAVLVCITEAKSNYNLTSSVKADLIATSPRKNCDTPGICKPVNVSVAANTLWYWCGFEASDKIHYNWKATSNTQSFLVRHRKLDKCDIKNFDSCHLVDKSKCDKVTKCTIDLHGFAFGGDVCLAIANNRNKTVWVNLQVKAEHDGTLAVGKAASVILTLVIAGWVFSPAAQLVYEKFTKQGKAARA